MSNISDFISKYWNDAVSASQKTGIDPTIILGQAAIETGWGAHAPQNNFFGIKGSGGVQSTKEFINGQWVTVNAAFKGYATPSASFAGYADFINKNPRYSGVAGSADQAAALSTAGYATDPAYATKVNSAAGKIKAVMNGEGSGRDYLKSVLGTDIGNYISDGLVGTGQTITDTTDAITNTLFGGLSLSGWFARITFGLLAVILIAIALFMLAGKPASVIAGKLPPVPV